MKEEVTLKLYRPNIFIKIGASLNIIFAAVFSVIGFTSFITIPAIVFNSFLFSSRVSDKRYWGTIRIIPIILSLLIGVLMFMTIFFASTLIYRMYNGIADVVNTVVFWSNGVLRKLEPNETVKKWFNISFIIVSFLGNIFILIGWYKGRTIATIETLSSEEKEEDNNNLKREHKNIKKEKNDNIKEVKVSSVKKEKSSKK